MGDQAMRVWDLQSCKKTTVEDVAQDKNMIFVHYDFVTQHNVGILF